MIYRIALVMALLASVCAAAPAGTGVGDPSKGSDWPHFGGPDYDASSPEKGLLREWPREGPKVLWKVATGRGVGCVSVAGNDLIFGQKEGKTHSETIRCLNAETGAEKWHYTYSCNREYWNWGWHWLGFKSTPTITDKYVFTIGLMGDLHCLDRKTGKVVWYKNMTTEWGPAVGEKGYSYSPLYADGKLIIHLGQRGKDKPTTVALDPATGKSLWVYSRGLTEDVGGSEGHTPCIATFGKDTCVVYASHVVTALRVSDGKVVWSEDPNARGGARGIPTPLIVGNVIVMIQDFAGAHAFEVDRANPGPAKRLWTMGTFPYSIYHNFVHHDGYLYGIFPRLDKDSTVIPVPDWDVRLYCFDLRTGKQMWEQGGFKSGMSLTVADGLLFVRENNNLHLVETTPKEYVEKGKIEAMHSVSNKDMSDHACVMPVLSRGRLYVRNPNELWCIKASDGKAH